MKQIIKLLSLSSFIFSFSLINCVSESNLLQQLNSAIEGDDLKMVKSIVEQAEGSNMLNDPIPNRTKVVKKIVYDKEGKEAFQKVTFPLTPLALAADQIKINKEIFDYLLESGAGVDAAVLAVLGSRGKLELLNQIQKAKMPDGFNLPQSITLLNYSTPEVIEKVKMNLTDKDLAVLHKRICELRRLDLITIKK